MKIKGLVVEDVANYKKASMFIIFPQCSFKCDRENGCKVCQNSHLANSKEYDIDINNLINQYVSNPITSSIVCGGLEPFDTFNELLTLVSKFREVTNDDIVIYTGYYKNEIEYKLSLLSKYENIIIKFGRFKPGQTPHYDEVLGVYLMNDEQYAEKIS